MTERQRQRMTGWREAGYALAFALAVTSAAVGCSDRTISSTDGTAGGDGGGSGDGASGAMGQDTSATASSASAGDGGAGDAGPGDGDGTATAGGVPMLDPSRCGDMCGPYRACGDEYLGCEGLCPWLVPVDSPCAVAFEDYVACLEASNCGGIFTVGNWPAGACATAFQDYLDSCSNDQRCSGSIIDTGTPPCRFLAECKGDLYTADCDGQACVCRINETVVGQCPDTDQLCDDRPALAANSCCGFQVPG